MTTAPTPSLTLRLCAAALCIATLGACPRDDSPTPTGPDGGSNQEEGGTTSIGGRGAAGSGGKLAEGGKGGVGGKPSAGAGGKAAPGAGGTTSAGTGGATSAGTGGQAGRPDPSEDAGASKLCGTRGAGMCQADEFCNFEPDKDCGGTDRGGSCETRPEVCDTSLVPVCGCDSHTYSNACNAHAAAVSVKHTGACTRSECENIGGRVLTGSNVTCRANEDMFSLGDKPTPQLCCVQRESLGKTCGGIANLQCAADEFCNYEEGQGCSGAVADAAGKCAVKPELCTKEYKPVCGCDSKTYGNLCEAHSLGASSMHDGACTVKDCERIGGRVAIGIGPAPMCNSDETEHTSVINNDGSMAIEGMLCCLKK